MEIAGQAWVGIESDEFIGVGVASILTDGGIVYAGGDLKSAGGVPVSGIAKWNGTTWENMNGGVWREFYPPEVGSVALDRDGRVYAAGSFSLAGGKSANGVSVWDGTDWGSFGVDQSVDNSILAMISDRKGGLYVAGNFTSAGGQVVNHVAHFDGAAWASLDGGLSGGRDETYARALALDHDGNLYVAGSFTMAGETPANNIAKWNGVLWEALGDGLNGDALSLAVDSHNNLYAGGDFNYEGTTLVNYVAKWTGSAWEALSSGMDLPVEAITVDDIDRLIAGGFINNAGGVKVYGLARWNGLGWEAMTDHFVDIPNAIITDHADLYLCGGQVWKFHNGDFELIGTGIASTDPLEIAFPQTMALDNQGNLMIGEISIWLGMLKPPISPAGTGRAGRLWAVG